jgi:hypothetical protein
MSYRVVLHKIYYRPYTNHNPPSDCFPEVAERMELEFPREMSFIPFHNLRLDFFDVQFTVQSISYDMRYDVFHCYQEEMVDAQFDFVDCAEHHRKCFWCIKKP